MKTSDGLGFGVSFRTNRTCYILFEVFKKRLHHELSQTKQSRVMCFRFREGLPKEACYLKQPIRSLQDRSRDSENDIYRCRNLSPSVSLIPRKRELIKHTFLSRGSKFSRIS